MLTACMRTLAFSVLLSASLAGCSESDAVSRDVPQSDAGMDAASSDGGSDATSDADDAAPDSGETRARLSQTGLFAASGSEALAPGVSLFRPEYELWSDGAEKRRWLYLPPAARIDATDMDYWVFPVGTKVWKEFTRDGVRVETRLLEKTAEGAWFMMAYQWNAEQTDAVAVPRGALDVAGTSHDIPSQTACGVCHDPMPDRLLGVSALQLSHAGAGITLGGLPLTGASPPAAGYRIPGDATERAALGYLHANCGNCHHRRSSTSSTLCLDLWLRLGELDSVEQTVTYATAHAIGVNSSAAPGGVTCRISGNDLANSAVYTRMNSRGESTQMPPIGSERVDTAGLAAVAAWISGLPASDAACTPACSARLDGGSRAR
jgi:mono/diheme cytochrome c family protein